MSDWDKLAGLELTIDDYELERLEQDVSSGFTRVSTIIRLRGAGEEGLGEDVSYDAEDHDAAQQAGPSLPLATTGGEAGAESRPAAEAQGARDGVITLGEFSRRLARLDLFPEPPVREVSRLYRRYAYESAALDLALRQAGTSLHAFLGKEPRPLTYVVSLRLGEPATIDPLASRLERYPGLRFKLDPTPSWTDELVEELARTGAVDSVDFKGFYTGTVVDNPPDPELYGRVLRALPDAWIEDPHLDAPIQELLTPHRDRVTWDAPIHGISDIEQLPFPPKMVNVKPSRVGSLEELFATYAYCEANGIAMYGGGQFELGAGRGQIQLLASLYHPDGPNDVSPSGFHANQPEPGLPTSPLPPAAHDRGFRWG